MNILVTGARGFVGRNLVENLKCIRDGKLKKRPHLAIKEIFEYDKENSLKQLEEWCSRADFVFNLAGVNRSQDVKEYMEVNYGFASTLLTTLKRYKNTCPVMFSSSQQAALAGRFGTSEYGLSKNEGEKLFFRYAKETGAEVYVYRFPNLAGKWIRPNYNSVVGTFCHNIARDLPITVNDPSVELELLFIDDLLEEMYDAIEGHPHRAEYPKIRDSKVGKKNDGLTPIPKSNGLYCYAPITHRVTLGRIVELLRIFHDLPKHLVIPTIQQGSFEKKLYSMYLTYLPKDKMVFDLKMNCDERGSFTELVKTANHGQISINISKPGVTKGQHWHNSKWELFIVVSGHGLIQQRKIGTEEVLEFEVSGVKIQAVHILPGYAHNIINLSDTDDLVVVMWGNEPLNSENPDTYTEIV